MEARKFESRMAELYAAWASGRNSEAFGFAAGRATTKAGSAAADLYELHVMEFSANDCERRIRRVKDWAYTEAATFAATRSPQGRVPGYRVGWARQAARDGLCDALWGHVRGTGLAIRAIQFGIGERPYQRVRDHVTDAAKAAMNDFETWLDDSLGAANGVD
jgi:hypothetical protein